MERRYKQACGLKKESKFVQATRWATHLVCGDCPGIFLDGRINIGRQCKQDDVVAAMPDLYFLKWTSKESMDDVMIIGKPPAKKKKMMLAALPGKITSYMDFCDQDRVNAINLQKMSFWTGCALPFLLVQSSFFISMLCSLNSAFVDKYLPKSDTFMQKWLPMIFASIQQKMLVLWKKQSGVLCTIGVDGFKTEINVKVFIFSELVGTMVSFKDLIAQEEERATGKYMGKIMIDCLIKGTVDLGGFASDVEKFYAAVVADNISSNLASAKLLQQKFPHVFFNGCRSHCADLLCEDICSKIPEIKSLVDEVHEIAKVIQHHPTVKAAFKQIVIFKKAGLMP